ncbi:autophagy protein 17 [Zalaria obscura]|uniref:Autophagy protein 17 n=1 Tax=Zalaria obscura TaxID=2024903 RepID=A0ACC3SHF5_9PEZI
MTPSPHVSPSASYNGEPTLEQLVTHFVAAKRSLSATTDAYRANEIVNTARELIEETAVLQAKNTFVRHGVEEEVSVLHSIRDGLDSVGRNAEVEFKTVITSLDVANDGLQETLSSLRATLIPSSVISSQPTLDETSSSITSSQSPPPPSQKTLHDFIDESTHLKLLDSLRATIDAYNSAQQSLQATISTFDTSLSSLHTSLTRLSSLSSSSTPPSQQDQESESIPTLFHTLTDHAHETASLLHSLIAHYDLCATALKHTEGGCSAARAANPSSSPFGQDESDSLYKDTPTPHAALDASSRAEMLAVLVADAAEVEDVVLEIRSRVTSMESSLDTLRQLHSRARESHKALSTLLSSLRRLGAEMPSLVAAARGFRREWAALGGEIEGKTGEIAELGVFYTGFADAYKRLLKEVARRDAVKAKMRKVAERARREIEALELEDRDMRVVFVNEVGEYLPRDIWPGLEEGAPRWVVKEVAREVGEGGGEGTLGEEGVEG